MSSFSINELLSLTGPILITDQLASPGDFLLHQLLSDHAKSSPDGKCIIVFTSQNLTRWQAISSRSGLNMVQKLEQGSIVFIDVPAQFPDLSSSKGTLLPLLDLIRRSIGAPHKDTPSLLIFDELALFQWVGHSEWDVSRFARALVSSCAKNNVFLAIRYHIAASDDLDDIVRILLQLSAYSTTSRSFRSPAGRAVRSVVRSRCIQAQCSPAPHDGPYHAAARCSIDWGSIMRLTLSEEQGMQYCEDSHELRRAGVFLPR